MLNFGKKGKDKITGFVGIITARCDYMYGCAQYSLQPEVDKDSKRPLIEWFDVGRIEIIGEGIKVEEVLADKPGCEYQQHP